MARASLFKNNRTQSVRLSKDVAFPESVRELEVRIIGSSRILTPEGQSWDHWFEHGARTTDDFLSSRDQPEAEEREVF